MAIHIGKRKKNENNREYAYRMLRKNIMNIWLEPGVALNENELSQLFGMSRTPIHEAIIKLRDEHLVDVQPQLASSISLIDLELLREGYFIRMCVEPTILKELAGKMGPCDLNILKQILEQQKNALESSDIVNDFFPLDDYFHRNIYDVYQMPHVWDTIKSISSHFDRVRFLDAAYYKSDKEYLRHFYEEHVRLYQLLLCGIPKDFDIYAYLDEHISSYKKSLLHITQEFPHYFLNL